MIRDIIHLNINVTDVERSIAFYELIGFKVMHVFGDRPDAEVGEGMAFQGGRCRGAVMSLGDHPRSWTKIELIEWVEPKVEKSQRLGSHASGVSRIALRTKNLISFVEELEAKGVEFETQPQEIDIVGAQRFALFRDPDDVLLELIEF
ncbi:MAG: VOC family protein [Deltaproteobacteria bacterium]|nr:VOC family protein [Deltaproteobacteria bacterium]